MQQIEYFLGIDGGGTCCRVRLVDKDGQVLGQGIAGPANLGLGMATVLDAVMTASRAAYAAAGLDDGAMARTHAGFGMAAANVSHHRQALERTPLPFASVTVRSDAETACLGAHGGAEGGVLILGTGSQGVVYAGGVFQTVSGWGFALSDDGSGAILGRAAVRRAFQAHDGVEPASALTVAIMQLFRADLTQMLKWAAGATPRDWAAFARVVFDYASQGDAVALELLEESAYRTRRMLERIRRLGAPRIALMGGLAEPIRPYLGEQPDLMGQMGDALDGALYLARQAADARACGAYSGTSGSAVPGS